MKGKKFGFFFFFIFVSFTLVLSKDQDPAVYPNRAALFFLKSFH